MLRKGVLCRMKCWIAVGQVLLLPLKIFAIAWAIVGLSTAQAAPPTLAGALSPNAPYPSGTCVDFEGLTFGATYSVGQVFIDSGAVISVGPFVWSNGTVFNGGSAYVDNNQFSGGSGLDVQTNNVTLKLDFGLPLSGLLFRFGEYGGNLNININGDFRNFDNFVDIHNLTIGSVLVSVVNGLGNDTGFVHLSGPINEFAVGGQELWLDDLCPETDCVDFEDLTLGATYPVGAGFVDSGVPVSVGPFEWSDGTVYFGGQAIVTGGSLSGGWGLDVNTNNVNLAFHFAHPLLKGLVFDFGEYGGNLNMNINGDFLNFENFADIDGLIVGGVQVKVLGGLGNDTGRVFLFGTVNTFAVGGQEFFIDNVCPASCCVEFESLPPMASYPVGAVFYDPDLWFEVMPFTWSDGTVYVGGNANVDHSQLAGGTGQDVNTNNVNLATDFGWGVWGLSLFFGEYGGNVNIEINSDFRNIANLADVDGATIGGVAVHVLNGFGGDKGRLFLDGRVHTFSIGGQEMWIDHICFLRPARIFLPLILRQ